MTVKGYLRGWETYYNETENEWRYIETDEPLWRVDKPCKKCGEPATDSGADYCLKGLEDCDLVFSACCGHGVEAGFLVLNDGRMFKQIESIDTQLD